MSMEELREAAIIATVVDRASQAGRFCGETFIQKSAFFLKELFGVPLRSTFRLYYYGPFSFDLRDQLRSMEADDVVRVSAHQWGATFVPGARCGMLQRQFPQSLRRYADGIEFVVRELAPLGVKELEPLATALFITRENPASPVNKRADKLTAVKPHIDINTARASVERIDRWVQQYSPVAATIR